MVYFVMVPRLLKVGFHILLPFLLFSFHVDHAMSTNDYIDSRCNFTANYTAGSVFQTNVGSLFSTLRKDAPPFLFANATVGQGSDTVYGLAQCRGDVDLDTCNACIYNSTTDVAGYCPNAMDAIIWYEKCQLRYSNTYFFGHLNVEDSGNWYWTNDTAQNPKAFNKRLGVVLKRLIHQATTEPSRLMFATGNASITGQKSIYGLVQCTRDTSHTDCRQCLTSTISQIPTTCENSQGCEIATGSCRVRFDTDLFYLNATSSSPSPAAPPPNSILSPSSSPVAPPKNSSPGPSLLPHSAPPSNSSPPSSGASSTTSDKTNHSSAISVSLITVTTFALTSAWLLMMPSWL